MITQTFYAVKVNGVIVSPKFSSRMVAEDQIQRLPENQRPLAEVVVVTNTGQELLLG